MIDNWNILPVMSEEARMTWDVHIWTKTSIIDQIWTFWPINHSNA